jgi:hypothetical protein
MAAPLAGTSRGTQRCFVSQTFRRFTGYVSFVTLSTMSTAELVYQKAKILPRPCQPKPRTSSLTC